MSELPDGVQPIGGHPMCGKETAGIEAATPDIYRNCTFVLTPLPRTSTAALALAEELVAASGARSSVMSADRHDSLVAVISHLPYILACTLVETTQEASSRDPAVWDLASSGYRSMSRLAASDVTMMLDIMATNKEEILAAVRAFEGHLQSLAQSVLSGNESKARSALDAIRAQHIKTS
jgi:prephenate dehydrogenase